jgi:hypothetical protein
MDREDAMVMAFYAIQYAVKLKLLQRQQQQDSRNANG